MEYFVHSRHTIRSIDPIESHVIISISNSDAERPKFTPNGNCVAVLKLAFHDITRIKKGKNPKYTTLFDEKTANLILDFWSENLHVESLYVHCDAGVSRSAAVAASLQKLERMDNEIWFKIKRPNKLVYRLICERGYIRKLNQM